MNESDQRQLWAQFIDGMTLSDSQRSGLARSIQNDASFAQQCLADAQLQNVVLLVAESADAEKAFVRRCLDEYQIQFGGLTPETATIHIDIENTESKKPALALDRIVKRKARAQWGTAILALATVLVIGCFVWVVQEVDVIGTKENHRDSSAVDAPVPEQPMTVETEQNLPNLNIPDQRDNKANPPQLVDLEQGQNEKDFTPSTENGAERQAPDGEFASLQTDTNTQWNTSISAGRIGACQLDLVEGFAAIVYDNQITLVLSAPAKVKLVSKSEVLLQAGWVQVECPSDGLDEFLLSSRDVRLSRLQDAHLHVQVNQQGTEVLLANGSLELNRIATKSDSATLRLKKGELTHALVSNVTANLDKQAPPFVIAHGQDQYLGQIGIDDAWVDAKSPEEFEALIDGSRSEAQGTDGLQFQQFNQLFRQIRNQFEEDGDRPNNDFSVPFEIPFGRAGGTNDSGESPFGGMSNFREMSERFFNPKSRPGNQNR